MTKLAKFAKNINRDENIQKRCPLEYAHEYQLNSKGTHNSERLSTPLHMEC